MDLNIREFLQEAGVKDAFYPGKKLIKACPQTGEFKSHCVVFDWHDPSTIRVEVKAGLKGHDLKAAELKKYPVSFQTPTYVELEVLNDNRKDDEEDEEGAASASGKGGGGKQPKTKKVKEGLSLKAFGKATEGQIPSLAAIKDMVVMGMKIGEKAYGAVLETLAHQLQHGKVAATELLAKGGDFITRYTPPKFMKPVEGVKYDKEYKYNREKNETMFGMAPR